MDRPLTALANLKNPITQGPVMEFVLLILCVVTAWAISTVVDTLPDLGQLLVPSPLMLGAALLVVVTWLMRD
ncbi:MAG: hypothetical protein ACFCVB_01025 [Nodosilinea sp.]